MFKIEQQPQGQQICFRYLKACLLNLSCVIYNNNNFIIIIIYTKKKMYGSLPRK